MELIIGSIIICLAIWGFNKISHTTQDADLNESFSTIVTYCVIVFIFIGLICILMK